MTVEEKELAIAKVFIGIVIKNVTPGGIIPQEGAEKDLFVEIYNFFDEQTQAEEKFNELLNRVKSHNG